MNFNPLYYPLCVTVLNVVWVSSSQLQGTNHVTQETTGLTNPATATLSALEPSTCCPQHVQNGTEYQLSRLILSPEDSDSQKSSQAGPFTLNQSLDINNLTVAGEVYTVTPCEINPEQSLSPVNTPRSRNEFDLAEEKERNIKNQEKELEITSQLDFTLQSVTEQSTASFSTSNLSSLITGSTTRENKATLENLENIGLVTVKSKIFGEYITSDKILSAFEQTFTSASPFYDATFSGDASTKNPIVPELDTVNLQKIKQNKSVNESTEQAIEITLNLNDDSSANYTDEIGEKDQNLSKNSKTKTPEPVEAVMFGGLPIPRCEGRLPCAEECGVPQPEADTSSQTEVDSSTEDKEIEFLSSLPFRLRRSTHPNSFYTKINFHADIFLNAGEAPKLNRYPDSVVTGNKKTGLTRSRYKLVDSFNTDLLSLHRNSVRRRRRNVGNDVVSDNLAIDLLEPSFTCQCDAKCVAFGDCCLDKLALCSGLLDVDEAALESFLLLEKEIEPKEDFSRVSLQEALGKHDENLAETISDIYLLEFGSCVNTSWFSGVYAISKCPEDFSDRATSDGCHSVNQPLLPMVSVNISATKVSTFKNAYCAMCHGIKLSDLQEWRTSVHCKSGVELEPSEKDPFDLNHLFYLIRDDSCQVHFSSPHTDFPSRVCQPGFDLTEEIKAQMDRALAEKACTASQTLLCMSYVVPHDGFRNPHCEQCSRHNDSHVARVRRDSHITCGSDANVSNQINNKKPSGGILLLLDFSGRYSVYGEESDRVHSTVVYACEDHQVYDSLVQRCHDLLCPHGFEPYRGDCVETKADVIYIPASSQLFPAPWTTITISTIRLVSPDAIKVDCYNLLPYLTQLIDSDAFFFTLKKLTINKYLKNLEKHEENQFEEIIGLNINVQCEHRFLLSTQAEEFDQIVLLLESDYRNDDEIFVELDYLTFLFVEDTNLDENVTVTQTNIGGDSENFTCPEDGVITEFTDFKLEKYKDIQYAVINTTTSRFYYPFQSVGFERRLTFSDKKKKVSENIAQSILVCVKHTFFSQENCSVISYWQNETKIIGGFNQTRLQILESGRIIAENQYHILEDRVLVCLDLGNSSVPWSASGDDDVYKTLSWICSSISISFLAAMLLLYWIFPELLTLPGRLTACLAATMLMTFALNLLTLTDVRHDILCPIVAVFAHFVTLSHYGWMSAIAVNMALTFGSTSLQSQSAGKARKTFLRYNVIVWSVSACIVSVSLTLDLTHGDEYHTPSVSRSEKVMPTTNLTTSLPPFSSSLQDNSTRFNEDFSDKNPVFFTENSTNHNSNIFDRGNATSSNFVPLVRKISTQYPKYGYPFCSWFSGPLWTRLAFVLIPYGLTLIVDVVGFTMTMRGIILSVKTSAKTLNRGVQYRTQCLIFLKLSAAMGFSWFISVFFTVSESRALVYVYVTLVLLQGLLLFLAFMFNKRVMLLLRNRFCRSPAQETRTAQTTSTRVSNFSSITTE